MLTILLTLFLLSLTLLLLSRRGLRIDNHPLCRKCKFDQTGKPSASSTCSECGADLSLPNSLLHGNRKRLPALTALALFLLAPSALLLALLAYSTATGTNLAPYSPLLLLRWQLADDRTGDTAAKEIQRRMDGSLLTPSDIAPLLDQCLARQADLHIPWSLRYGDIIDTAEKDKLIDPVRLQRYVSQVVSNITINARSRFHSNDDAAFHFSFDLERCGKSHYAGTWLVEGTATLDFDKPLTMHLALDRSASPVTSQVSTMRKLKLPPLPLGPYHYTFEYTLTITSPTHITATRTGIYPFNFELIIPSLPLVRLTPSGLSPADFQKIITIDSDRTPPGTIDYSALIRPRFGDMNMNSGGAPIPLMIQGILIQDGLAWPLEPIGSQFLPAQNCNTVLTLDRSKRPPLPLHPGPAHLLFIPDLTAIINDTFAEESPGDPFTIPITILPPH